MVGPKKQALFKIFYEMQGKVCLPPNRWEDNKDMAATVAANFASIGFPMQTNQIQELSTASREDIIGFYKLYMETFSGLVGADKQPTPFYPDFPEGCMNRCDAEYFIDQIVYGLSGLQLEPSQYMEEKKRFPFIGTPMRHVILDAKAGDLYETLQNTINSEVSYSKIQRDFINKYLEYRPGAMVQIIENAASMKNRENAIACAMMVEKHAGRAEFTPGFIKQPVDVLRIAAFKSVEKENKNKETPRDPYTAIALRDKAKKSVDNVGRTTDAIMPKFALSRKDRKFVMDMLAKMDRGDAKALASQMNGHKEEWLRLFKNLHLSDKAWNNEKYSNVCEAIYYVQQNKKFDRAERRIEEAIKSGDVKTAVKELKNRPGDFMRRFDKLYRMALKTDREAVAEVLTTLKEVSPKAGIATVTATIGNISKRDHAETARYFKDKNGKVTMVTDKNREGFTDTQIKVVNEIAMSGLVERFKGKEPLGKVYMSESLRDVSIPTDIRASNGGIGGMTSGSKIPIANSWDKMRFFVTWTNIDESKTRDPRVDIDLSVAMCDKDMNIISMCSWDSSYGDEGYIFSGDVQDGGESTGEGRAEFIDVDLQALKNKGIAYIIPQVNSYTSQPFAEQPHTAFGVMQRAEDDMGKIFEPGTVVNRFVLDSNTTCVAPYIIDVENHEIVWMNEKSQQSVATHGLYDMIKRVNRTLDSKVMPLDKLVEANVRANGRFVESPKNADVLFVRDTTEMEEVMEEFDIKDNDKFILSSNMEYITGYLLKDGEKDQPRIIEEKEKADDFYDTYQKPVKDTDTKSKDIKEESIADNQYDCEYEDLEDDFER